MRNRVSTGQSSETSESDAWVRRVTEGESDPVIKGVVYDADGFAINSIPWLVSFEQQFFRDNQLNVDPVAYKEGAGMTFEDFLRALKRPDGSGVDNAEELSRKFHLQLGVNYVVEVDAAEGFPEMVAAMTRMQIQQAVATNNQVALVRRVLIKARVEKVMKIVLGADQSRGRPKPHPWMIEEAFRHMGVAPTSGAVAGDSTTDMGAAIQAGAARFYGLVSDHNAHLADRFNFIQQGTVGKAVRSFEEIVADIKNINRKAVKL